MKRLLLIMVSVVFLTSCSYLGVNKAPPKDLWSEIKYENCTETPLLPTGDTLLSISNVTSGVSLLVMSAYDKQVNTNFGYLGGFLLGSGIIHTTSAIYGFRKTSQCRRFLGDSNSRNKKHKTRTCITDLDCPVDQECVSSLCQYPN